jgi:hypothetical protein
MLGTFILNWTLCIKNPSFSNKKSPSAKGQRAGNGQAPPIGKVWNFLLGRDYRGIAEYQ